jgi:hypothetical protein
VRALAANRQRAAVTQAAVAAEVHQTLDVHGDFAAQVAFDLIIAVDRLADGENFGVRELVDAAIERNADLGDDLGSELLADAVNVLKRNDDALVGGMLTPAIRAIFSSPCRPLVRHVLTRVRWRPALAGFFNQKAGNARKERPAVSRSKDVLRIREGGHSVNRLFTSGQSGISRPPSPAPDESQRRYG